MPTIPNRTRYASFGVAATIFEAADASKTYVRMPTSNATIEPRTTGTWYVGVCESSRHDWPNPTPDFVRVASMVLSPPGSRPRCQGIWVLGQFSNRGIVPIRMMWLGLSRKLLLSLGAIMAFPPESASLSKNGEHWPRRVSLPTTDPPSVRSPFRPPPRRPKRFALSPGGVDLDFRGQSSSAIVHCPQVRTAITVGGSLGIARPRIS